MQEEQAIKQIKRAFDISSETSDVEFKDARGGFPRTAWQSISSFSHRPGGGLIVFGVTEEKKENDRIFKSVGITDIATIQKKMGGLCNQNMSVVIRPEYYPITLDDKLLLAVYIPECPNQFKPCYYKSVGLPNGAYIRDGNSDRKITDDEMRRMLDAARMFKFDATIAPGTSIQDISSEKVFDLLTRMGQRTKRDASSDEIDLDLLKNLGIADQFESGTCPTIAGFLIFSNTAPQKKRAFDRYIVRGVKYKGSSVATDILDSADIGGTLDQQIEGMHSFILKNIRKSALIVGSKRVERYEYPEKAIQRDCC